ncbi:hypothetical protein EDB85DRAFT_1895515 [Lactarius pseudohatsudake]|nr:hypothetical protein EDB85DRAFT_1895515 [Lactarius pseudohatsudake]
MEGMDKVVLYGDWADVLNGKKSGNKNNRVHDHETIGEVDKGCDDATSTGQAGDSGIAKRRKHKADNHVRRHSGWLEPSAAGATARGNADEVGEHEVGNTCAGGHGERVFEERVGYVQLGNDAGASYEAAGRTDDDTLEGGASPSPMGVQHRSNGGHSPVQGWNIEMDVEDIVDENKAGCEEEERAVGGNGEQAGWKQDCQNGVAFIRKVCTLRTTWLTLDQRICLIPKSATQILLTSATHPHPSPSPTLPPSIRSAWLDPRHEDAVIASGPTLPSPTWPTIDRCHARHHVRCVGASLCRERGDEREVAVRLHPRAAPVADGADIVLLVLDAGPRQLVGEKTTAMKQIYELRILKQKLQTQEGRESAVRSSRMDTSHRFIAKASILATG